MEKTFEAKLKKLQSQIKRDIVEASMKVRRVTVRS